MTGGLKEQVDVVALAAASRLVLLLCDAFILISLTVLQFLVACLHKRINFKMEINRS